MGKQYEHTTKEETGVLVFAFNFGGNFYFSFDFENNLEKLRSEQSC